MTRLSSYLGRNLRFGWFAALALLVAPSAWGETLGTTGETRAKERLSEVRIPFIANSGQTDPAVAYYAPTFAGTVFVTKDGRIVYSLPGEEPSAPGERSPDKRARSGGWSLTETFIGGRARPSGSDPASTRVSSFLGNDPARWRSGLPTFGGVSLGEVWPGISLDLRAHGKNVEKLFTVEPGGDPSRIRMSVAGARWLRINPAGALVVGTGLGEVTFTPPAASQERQGVRHSVTAAYELRGREYGFRLGDYDPAFPVLIDPLLQSTFLGGSGADQALALAIHPTSGEVYVAGFTGSTNFPGTAGGAQAANGGGVSDAFVARLNAALTTLNQATYLGGGGQDRAQALAFHPTSGEVYVAGITGSTNFPGTAGGAQPANGGGNGTDAFVARLDATLTTLNQATYLGGNGFDSVGTFFNGSVYSPGALAIHPTSGEVYVAGLTESANFPGTAGGAQPAHGGGSAGALKAFVARLNAALTTLHQATYLGGNLSDEAFALAIHPTSGEVYVAGSTSSFNFPGTAGGAQPATGGSTDAFVARLNAALTTLNQATYLGGIDDDRALALAIHPTSGEVYVAGVTGFAATGSTNFPGTAGGAQPASGTGFDGFVARLDAALTTLHQATYLGGNGGDGALALTIHPTSGDVYVAGFTDSTNFPGTAGGAQAANRGTTDAFVASLNAGLTTLDQATYLGGTGADGAQALAIHPTSGEVYVAGFTNFTNFTNFPGTAGGAQPTNGGITDAFVARLTADLAGAPGPLDQITISPATATIPAGGSQPYTAQGFDASNNSLGNVTGATTFSISPDGSCTGGTCTASIPGPHIVTGNDGGKTATASLTVTSAPLDHITISPATATIPAGGSQPYTAQGFDASNNSLGNVTGATTFSISPDGSCAGATCTASIPGPHTVTGNDGGKTATASLTVTSVVGFAGTPGQANCYGTSVAALARQFGGLRAAASALGFSSVQALQRSIRGFCKD